MFPIKMFVIYSDIYINLYRNGGIQLKSYKIVAKQ